MEFGEQLLMFRAKHKLTQLELSRLLNVSVTMVYFYESGKSSPSKANKIYFENVMNEYERSKENV